VKERCKELRKESGIVLEIVEREALKVGKDYFLLFLLKFN